jgi:hypothetical protein
MSKITQNLDNLENDCLDYIKQYDMFGDLWFSEPEEAF